MLNKIIRIRNGFTLVEILVSMFIIITLTTLLLVNYHSTNSRAALITAAQKLASDIRLAQEYSLGSKEFGGTPPQVPQGGWGVYLTTVPPNNVRYIIFADDDGDYIYDMGEELQTINLPKNVTIDSINTGSPVNNSATVLFIPPDPETRINNDVNIKNVKITLKESAGATKSVEVNFLGLVDVVD